MNYRILAAPKRRKLNLFDAPHYFESDKRARNIASKLLACGTILDVGISDGSLLWALKKYLDVSQKVQGLDIADLRKVDVPLIIYNGVNFPFQDNSFGAVNLSCVLHHCDEPINILSEARRVSSKRLVILEDTPINSIQRLFCRFHAYKWNKKAGDKKSMQFLTAKEWKKIFNTLGLDVVYEKKDSNIWSWVHPVRRTLFVLEK